MPWRCPYVPMRGHQGSGAKPEKKAQPKTGWDPISARPRPSTALRRRAQTATNGSRTPPRFGFRPPLPSGGGIKTRHIKFRKKQAPCREHAARRLLSLYDHSQGPLNDFNNVSLKYSLMGGSSLNVLILFRRLAKRRRCRAARGQSGACRPARSRAHSPGPNTAAVPQARRR